MENAARALVMAAGVLLGILIISLLMFAYSKYQALGAVQENIAAIESIVEFNAQFDTYNRDDVRGNDLLSLVNKISSYNETQSEKYGYGELTISIATTTAATSKFSYDGSSLKWLPANNVTLSISTLEAMLEEVNLIENDLGSVSIAGNLVNKIGAMETAKYNSVDAEYRGENDDWTVYPIALIGATKFNTLGWNYDVMMSKLYTYYEYSKFKQGYFDCKNVTTDANTGRMTGFWFEFNGKIN